MDAWLARHRIGIYVFTALAVLFGLPLITIEVFVIAAHFAR